MIAISTAFRQALIAIEIDGQTNFESLDSNCKHSENLLPSLDEVLESMGENLAKNNNFAVVIGPGSFTGLRISSALVKGLLAGDERKCVLPLTTFDLMAYSYINNFIVQEDFVCVINALSGRYFICKYNRNGEKLTEEQMVDADALALLTETKIALTEEGCGNVLVTPSPEELLSLANKKANNQKLISAGELSPMYIRKSQAEESKN